VVWTGKGALFAQRGKDGSLRPRWGILPLTPTSLRRARRELPGRWWQFSTSVSRRDIIDWKHYP